MAGPGFCVDGRVLAEWVMRVATWNAQWATPTSARGRAIRGHLETVGADVVVTTEDYRSVWDRYPSVVDGGAEWGYPVIGNRRKVIAWSAAPWSDVHVVDTGAAKGRLVSAVTVGGGVAVTVVAVCIPWAAAHVSSGRRDRGRWDDHVEFCATLGDLLGSLSGPVVVAGDFNQAIPRQRQPLRVHAVLMQAFDGFEVASAGCTEVGPLIDHVALGRGLASTGVYAWSKEIDGVRLTDHAGVAVDAEWRPEEW